jgi:hypothetical protein
MLCYVMLWVGSSLLASALVHMYIQYIRSTWKCRCKIMQFSLLGLSTNHCTVTWGGSPFFAHALLAFAFEQKKNACNISGCIHPPSLPYFYIYDMYVVHLLTAHWCELRIIRKSCIRYNVQHYGARGVPVSGGVVSLRKRGKQRSGSASPGHPLKKPFMIWQIVK